jgi:hypothetical protein
MCSNQRTGPKKGSKTEKARQGERKNQANQDVDIRPISIFK